MSETPPEPDLPPLIPEQFANVSPETEAVGSIIQPAEPPLISTAVESPSLALPPLLIQPISRRLITAVIALGVIQLGLGIVGAIDLIGAKGVSYRIGYVLGGTVFWPLICIGVFSIWRSFRNTRSRLLIILWVWGLFILTHLGTISRHYQLQAKAGAVADALVANEEDAESEEEEATTVKPDPGEAVAGDNPDAPRESFDLSAGSDQRLIKLIDGAQQARYRAVVAAYVIACRERPQDAILALERVRFIERFAFSEDSVIEGADADLKVASKFLKENFPKAPGTVLHLLGQKYGEKLEVAAAEYEYLIPRWTPVERAEFLLLRAQAADITDAPKALTYARESFALNPTVQAGLLLAEKAQEAKRPEESVKVLMNPVFDTAEPWFRKRKLNLLLKTGDTKQMIALYEELKAASPQMVRDAETAQGLAQAGRIEQAREVFASIVENDWNRGDVTLKRFKFELVNGDADQVLAAYRKLRSTDLLADPFLRHRLAVFWKYPGAGWAGEDLVGAALLAFLTGLLVFSPLLLLIPIHYWSLLREKKGKTGGWKNPSWGLRYAWLGMGTILVGDGFLIWLLRPELMHSWMDESKVPVEDPAVPQMWLQIPSWGLMGVLLLCLLWRGRAWRLLGPGQWAVGKSIGIALGLMFGLRMLLVCYTRIWPQSLAGETTAITSETGRLIIQLMEKFGPWGALGFLAVLVPLLEETLFRGVLLQAFGKHIPFGWANAVQAVMFALVHENYRLFPFFFLFGCVCGELTRRAQGLLPALVFHAGNNALACLSLLLLNRIPA